MRCKACDRILEDFEATRKYSGTQHYVDLCNKCYSHIKDDLSVTERADLLTKEEAYEDDYIFKEYEL